MTTLFYRRMQWCHTDLGALVFRRSRLLEEDMRFGLIAQAEASPGPEHADGLLAAKIVEAGKSGIAGGFCCVHHLTTPAHWHAHRRPVMVSQCLRLR